MAVYGGLCTAVRPTPLRESAAAHLLQACGMRASGLARPVQPDEIDQEQQIREYRSADQIRSHRFAELRFAVGRGQLGRATLTYQMHVRPRSVGERSWL